jgi:hypothetical protein
MPNDSKQNFISYLRSKKYIPEQIEELEETKILQSFLLEHKRGREILNLIIEESIDKMIARNNL